MRLILIFLVILTTSPAVAQFTDEFRGRLTRITYANEAGECVNEEYTTKLGLFDRSQDAIPLSGSLNRPGASIDDITDVGLAMEHYWMSFELNMKAQREYRSCVAKIEMIQEIMGECQLTHECNPNRDSILLLSEYWIPFNAIDNFFEFPPGLSSYIGHFKAGVFTLNRMIAHRDACRGTLAFYKARILGLNR